VDYILSQIKMLNIFTRDDEKSNSGEGNINCPYV
jgi:hypothetical protein